ncbi:MAG: histidinol-phosphate transaminase [Amphiplicatus sp.]
MTAGTKTREIGSDGVTRRAMIGGAAGAAAFVGSGPRAASPSAPSFGAPAGFALLSRNENPYGPSPKAVEAACEASKNGAYYADRSVLYLADMIAERNGVTRDFVSISAGSGEGLCAAAQAWTRGGGKILAPSLFWDTTARYAERQGAGIVRAPLADDLGVDLAAMEGLVDEAISLVHITNPNNPTGLLLDPAALKAFCLRVEPKATVLVDEAYNELTDDPDGASIMPLVRDGRNVIVSRTFSKIYGMAGMRVGYLLARPDITAKIRSNIMSWISAPGLAAATASYNDQAFLRMSKARIGEGRDRVMNAARAQKLSFLPSQANFVFVNVGRDATWFMEKMEEKQIFIRGAYPDYATWSRVSMGRIEDMARYVRALPEVLAG